MNADLKQWCNVCTSIKRCYFYKLGSGLIISKTRGWFFIASHLHLILLTSRPYSAKSRSNMNLSNIFHSLSSGFLKFFLATQRKQLTRCHWILSTFSGSSRTHRSIKKIYKKLFYSSRCNNILVSFALVCKHISSFINDIPQGWQGYRLEVNILYWIKWSVGLDCGGYINSDYVQPGRGI